MMYIQETIARGKPSNYIVEAIDDLYAMIRRLVGDDEGKKSDSWRLHIRCPLSVALSQLPSLVTRRCRLISGCNTPRLALHLPPSHPSFLLFLLRQMRFTRRGGVATSATPSAPMTRAARKVHVRCCPCQERK